LCEEFIKDLEFFQFINEHALAVRTRPLVNRSGLILDSEGYYISRRKGMKDRLRVVSGMTTGRIICGVLMFLLLATSAYGTAVQVINFPALMSMVQKMVTQVITDKIKAVWDEEVKMKLEPGSINTRAVSFVKYNISSFTDKMISQYMKNSAGAFARGDGKLFAETAKSKTAPIIPSVNSDFKDFQKKIREVSILLAGVEGHGISPL
jgi:hypothetical protein